MSVLPKTKDRGIHLRVISDHTVQPVSSQERAHERDSRQSRRSRPAVVRFLLLAAASATMYLVFFRSCDQLFPLLTSCTLIGALAVIGLALSFCLVYGTCAGQLLELLGFRELE